MRRRVRRRPTERWQLRGGRSRLKAVPGNAARRRESKVGKGCALGAALLAVAVPGSVAGCGTPGPLRGSNPVKPVNSIGCYTGPAAMSASPADARPSEVVTLSARGLPRDRLVILQDLGEFGTVSGRHFAASWYLTATAYGSGRHPHDIKAGSGGGFAGTGLPDRPFDIEVPPVPGGNYVIQFDYSAAPASMSTSTPESYTLCAQLHVNQ